MILPGKENKHSFKLMFYANRVEADPCTISGKEGYLTPDEEAEEKLFIEFIEVHGGAGRYIMGTAPCISLTTGHAIIKMSQKKLPAFEEYKPIYF